MRWKVRRAGSHPVSVTVRVTAAVHGSLRSPGVGCKIARELK